MFIITLFLRTKQFPYGTDNLFISNSSTTAKIDIRLVERMFQTFQSQWRTKKKSNVLFYYLHTVFILH